MLKVPFKDLVNHETKRNSLTKFLLLLTVVVVYFIFISQKYGVEGGFLITLLTWSFFVFCTPIADAGFLLDFPVRIITGMRMIYTEIFVWIFAAVLNIAMLVFNPEIYNSTFLLQLFHYILTHPVPMWSIIILSALGTFLSIYFADEMVDVVEHKQRKKFQKYANKYSIIIFVFIFAGILALYRYLIDQMHLNIPL